MAIDEFHHVSADAENRLGELLRDIMRKSTAHIMAMTGSFFRGDSVPILLPEDEEKFTKIISPILYTFFLTDPENIGNIKSPGDFLDLL